MSEREGLEISDPSATIDQEKREKHFVIISGGSQGIGRGITESLLRGEGADIAICSRTQEKLEAVSENFPKLITERVDLSDPAEAHGFVVRATERLGGLDTLVLNAGITGVEQIPNETPDQTRRRKEQVFDVNTVAPVAMIQAARPYLKESGGTIVFLTSRFAQMENPPASAAAYAHSKKTMEQYLDKFTANPENKGIFVFSVDPGSVDTQLRQDIIARGPKELAEIAVRERDAGLLAPPELIGDIISKMTTLRNRWNPKTQEYDLPIKNGERVEISRVQVESELAKIKKV